jgi:HAD superfamily hydrolase (TIGR01509 family)
MKNTPKCVLFDCDGVLVDSECLAMRVELQELARLGLDLTKEFYQEKLLGQSKQSGYHAIVEIAAAQGLRKLPSTLVDDLAKLRKDAYVRELVAIQGIYEFLKNFEGDVAVVTSSSRTSAQLKLKITGLEAFFATEKVFSIDLATHGKPHPELYEIAIRELGYHREEYLAIEDSTNGVKSAKAAGLIVWGFVGGQHLDTGFGEPLIEAGADRIIDRISLEEFEMDTSN